MTDQEARKYHNALARLGFSGHIATIEHHQGTPGAHIAALEAMLRKAYMAGYVGGMSNERDMKATTTAKATAKATIKTVFVVSDGMGGVSNYDISTPFDNDAGIRRIINEEELDTAPETCSDAWVIALLPDGTIVDVMFIRLEEYAPTENNDTDEQPADLRHEEEQAHARHVVEDIAATRTAWLVQAFNNGYVPED